VISQGRPWAAFLLMNRSKKIFFALAIAYLVALVWVSVDIASKTTFPHSRPQLKERLKERFTGKDSVKNDSIFRHDKL
jgi:hypothetical protein